MKHTKSLVKEYVLKISNKEHNFNIKTLLLEEKINRIKRI